jgi:hypothetical protein
MTGLGQPLAISSAYCLVTGIPVQVQCIWGELAVSHLSGLCALEWPWCSSPPTSLQSGVHSGQTGSSETWMQPLFSHVSLAVWGGS